MTVSYRLQRVVVGLLRSLVLVAPVAGSLVSCSSSDTGAQQPTEGGSGDATGMAPRPDGDAGTDDGAPESTGVVDARASDATPTCTSFSSP